MPPKQAKPDRVASSNVIREDPNRFSAEIAQDRLALEDDMTPRQWEEIRNRIIGRPICHT